MKRNTLLWVRRSARLAICPMLLALSACGAAKRSDAARNAICQPASRQVIAQNISLAPAEVSQRRSTASNSYPQCLFQATLRSGARFRALINVDTGPQAYFVLERTAVEDAQNFAPKRLYPPPLSITGLGLEADWFPQYPHLMATDGFRLLTITVIWPRHAPRSERQLAIAIARPYLHTPHGKLAQRIAQGYPG
jgi:hypothetical protein